MEQNQESSLFGLTLDGQSKNHLKEIAAWGRFLAVTGFIFGALFIIIALMVISRSSEINNAMSYRSSSNPFLSVGGLGTGIAIMYFIMAVIFIVPSIFQLKFGNQMKTALAADDIDALNGSLTNMKITFRFWGIVAIVLLALFLISMLSSLG
jgi:preprotein translocase subunit SecG